MKIILTFLSVAILLLIFSDFANACSCAKSPPVNIAFQSSPNVAILKVKAVEKYKDNEKGYGYGGIKQSRLTVEKVFKGNLKSGQELIFAQGGGADCIWTFGENSVGAELLFYLGDKPISSKSSENIIAATGQFPRVVEANVWVAFTCSRSDSIKYRQDDLKYLENINKVRGKTRLSGVILQSIESSVEEVRPNDKLLANRTVHIVGNGKDVTVRTDENGVYEIYDLPVGKYQISVEQIDGYKTTGFNYPTEETRNIQIKPQQHIEQNFTYFIDNSISGRFFDVNGKVLKDVCLDLVPVHGQKRQYFHSFDCMEKDGSFKFSQIPAGRYIIVVNDDNKISFDEPFHTFYYPTATKREEAKEISIGAGEHIKDIVIKAPTSAEVITISGVVLFENKISNDYGYISVEFVPDKKNKIAGIDGKSRTTVEKNGQFSLRVLKGQKGKFYGELLTYSGERVNCPKLEKILRAQGERSMSVNTNSISIDAIKDLSGAVLNFPFPNCRKAKIE